ncbi:Glutaredoxin [Dillenia turbinata]|uniref:Glutaredoxin n=1 Tax=Dillenia turbinata TaxID=194707 RepID=A0AAN8UH75_9MAGN
MAVKRNILVCTSMAVFIYLLPLVISSSSSPEAVFVKNTISSHPIVIFSKIYCPYCNRAKAVFKKLNKVPHVVELDQRGLFSVYSEFCAIWRWHWQVIYCFQ